MLVNGAPDTLNRIKREIPFRDSKMFRSVFEVHLKANSNRFPMIQMILWGPGKGLEEYEAKRG